VTCSWFKLRSQSTIARDGVLKAKWGEKNYEYSYHYTWYWHKMWIDKWIKLLQNISTVLLSKSLFIKNIRDGRKLSASHLSLERRFSGLIYTW
jgi:hypothetical protein